MNARGHLSLVALVLSLSFAWSLPLDAQRSEPRSLAQRAQQPFMWMFRLIGDGCRTIKNGIAYAVHDCMTKTAELFSCDFAKPSMRAFSRSDQGASVDTLLAALVKQLKAVHALQQTVHTQVVQEKEQLQSLLAEHRAAFESICAKVIGDTNTLLYAKIQKDWKQRQNDLLARVSCQIDHGTERFEAYLQAIMDASVMVQVADTHHTEDTATVQAAIGNHDETAGCSTVVKTSSTQPQLSKKARAYIAQKVRAVLQRRAAGQYTGQGA